MSKIQEYQNEYKLNGMWGVWKRVLYIMPNRLLINKVKKKPLEYGINREDTRKNRIIVSLTSYPARFDNIYLCLKSLLLQDLKPDRIIVWFGNDTHEQDLTREMLSLKKYGIEYRLDRNINLKPHKKYFYSMQEFPNDIIITVDDDSVYPSTLVSSLMKSYQKHPNAVSARRVHLMTFGKDGRLLPYSNWKMEYRKLRKESKDLLAVGVGGILYPPHIFDKRVFNVEEINKLCLNADDIWLKCMELLNDITVVWVPAFFSHPPALTTKSSLGQINVNYGRNDESIQKVVSAYGIRIIKNEK